MCISPMRKKLKTKDGVVKFIDYPCGKCYECVRSRRSDWVIRLSKEALDSHNAVFVTLTYSDENLPWTDEGPSLDKPDVQKFLKLLRFYQEKEVKRRKKKKLRRFKNEKVRYFLIGEYGPRTERPHYHALLFNVYYEVLKDITKIWDKGHTRQDRITPNRINYVAGYFLLKNDIKVSQRVKPFSMMSLKPAIGYQYMKDFGDYFSDNEIFTTVYEGKKYVLPRYYRNKLFGEREKEEFKDTIVKELEKKFQTWLSEQARKGVDGFALLEERKKQSIERYEKRFRKGRNI